MKSLLRKGKKSKEETTVQPPFGPEDGTALETADLTSNENLDQMTSVEAEKSVSKPSKKAKKPRVRQSSFGFSSMYRTVTLSVEKDVIRVVVFRGQKITSWGTAPLAWAPGQLEAAGHPEPEKEKPPLAGLLNEMGIKSGGRLRALLNQFGIRRGRVVMDFSLYTTLMRHLQVPNVTGRYLEPMIVSEVLEAIPFQKQEVDISWHVSKGEEVQSVFAVTLPKNRVDSQVRLVKDSGLIPAAAYSKANVLALAAGVPDAIVVHLEHSQAAIVLVAEGDPQVVHQVDFAEGEQNAEEQSEAIARAIDQVAGYHQSFDPQLRTFQMPVILTGEDSTDTNPVVKNLKQFDAWEIRSFSPSVICPEDFPAEAYATNIGLLLADRVAPQQAENASATEAPALDLLPKRHLPIPLPTFQAAVFVTLLLLALHPFDFSDWVAAQEQRTQSLQQELTKLEREEKSHDILLASHRESQSGYKLARSQTIELQSRIGQLEDSVDLLLTRLEIITHQAKPETISILAVAPSAGDLTVVGSAQTYADALRYASNLRSYEVFEDARTMQIQGTDGSELADESFVNFQIKVSLPGDEEAEEESES